MVNLWIQEIRFVFGNIAFIIRSFFFRKRRQEDCLLSLIENERIQIIYKIRPNCFMIWRSTISWIIFLAVLWVSRSCRTCSKHIIQTIELDSLVSHYDCTKLCLTIWPRTNLKNKQILGWQEVKREEEKNTRDKAVRPRGRDYVHVISDWFLNLQS